MQLQHGFAVGFLKLLDLPLVLFLDVQWLAAQGILQVFATFLSPFLDLGRGQIVCPARLHHAGLALDDLVHQGRLALGRPALEFLVHHRAHVISLSRL
jgi:hypothetical protein